MTYLYDCHVHTAETSWCGRVPAGEMAQLYKQAGYTGIVIIDHYQGIFQRCPKIGPGPRSSTTWEATASVGRAEN